MRASIVRRHDLDVLDLAASVVPFTLDAQVGELHVTVDHRQLVVVSPPGNVLGRPARSPGALAPPPIGFL